MENKNPVPCPLCNGLKKGKNFAVCFKCKQQYLQEAARVALGRKTPPTFEKWLVEKITAGLPKLEELLEQAREELRRCDQQQFEILDQDFEKRTEGIIMDPDVEDEARKTHWRNNKDKVWENMGGKVVFRKSQIAGERLKEAKRVLADLEKKTSSTTPLVEEAEQIIKSRT